MRIRFLLFIVILFVVVAPSVMAQSDDITGLWMTEEKDGVVEIYSCDNHTFCGRFYWLKDDSAESPSRDDRNPDPDKKMLPLCGMTFMGGFASNGEGLYEGGWIYSIRHGATFSAQMALIDNETLRLRGYMFLPFLGGGQNWKRVETASPCYLLRQNRDVAVR